MISGSRDDDLYARQGTERPCYWFQTSMGMYFLACGASRSLFDVLNHVGITLSYTQAISKLKRLSEERLTGMRKIAKSKAFMLIWDNLNIVFKVSEQRHDSKDHFDNGTTVTLVLLYGVEYGKLSSPAKANKPSTCSQVWSSRPSPKPRGSSTRSSWPTLAHQRHFR
jgi:hypothetical protein